MGTTTQEEEIIYHFILYFLTTKYTRIPTQNIRPIKDKIIIPKVNHEIIIPVISHFLFVNCLMVQE